MSYISYLLINYTKYFGSNKSGLNVGRYLMLQYVEITNEIMRLEKLRQVYIT